MEGPPTLLMAADVTVRGLGDPGVAVPLGVPSQLSRRLGLLWRFGLLLRFGLLWRLGGRGDEGDG